MRRDKIGFVYQRHNLFGGFYGAGKCGAADVDARCGRGRCKYSGVKAVAGGKCGASRITSAGRDVRRRAAANRRSRALANGPEILLADEPTGSLDPAHAAAVFDLLLDLVRKNKMAMLFVTHDMNLAARADRTITIKDGIVQ